VLQGVNPYQVKEGLEKWVLDIPLGIQGAAARLINIDRKRIRENGFHGVSAWMGEQGLPHGCRGSRKIRIARNAWNLNKSI
jgi:hypothetical protein